MKKYQKLQKRCIAGVLVILKKTITKIHIMEGMMIQNDLAVLLHFQQYFRRPDEKMAITKGSVMKNRQFFHQRDANL